MSLYRFLAANEPLQEVDYSGFQEITVREIKSMDPIPEPPEIIDSWDDLDDDEVLLYAESEDALGGLCIAICDKPPAGLKDYIKLPYIYWVDGDFEEKMVKQLVDYIQQHATLKNDLQFWTIWFGEEEFEPVVEQQDLASLTVEKLLSDAHRDCHCVIFQ